MYSRTPRRTSANRERGLRSTVVRLRELEILLTERLKRPLPGAASHMRLVPEPPRGGWWQRTFGN